MGALSYFVEIKYDFIIAWAALFGGLGGITSWIYKNDTMRKNDTAKLSDARQERLSIIASDILEKTYHVHRAIHVIASPFSSANEMYAIEDEKKDESEEEPKDKFKLRPNVSQAEIFGHRFQRYEKLFSEYYSLDIKAKVYFNETVVKHIDEMKSVISFINSSINRLYRYSNEKYRPPKNPDQAFKREQKILKIEEEIWAFSDPDSYETFFTTEDIRDLFKERIEVFACVCEKLDAELGDYVRGVK